MKGYRSLPALVLLVILAHTHVTILPGWTVPVIPLILVSAIIAMTGVLLGALHHSQRAPVRRALLHPPGRAASTP